MKKTTTIISSVFLASALASGVAGATPSEQTDLYQESAVLNVQSNGVDIEYESLEVKERITQSDIDKILQEYPKAKKITFYDRPQVDPSQAVSSAVAQNDEPKTSGSVSPQSLLYSYTCDSLQDLWRHGIDYPTEYITTVAKGMTIKLGHTFTSSKTTTWGAEAAVELKEVVNLKGTYNKSGTVTETISAETTFTGPPESSKYNQRVYKYLVYGEAYSYTVTKRNVITGSSEVLTGLVAIPRYEPFSVDQ